MAYPATAAALSAAVLADPARDIHVRMVYDAANRLAYSVDGVGAVAQNVYDADGNVVRTVANANALSPTQLASLGTNPSVATMQSLVAGVANAAQDRVEQPVLDAG